jgi:hypothetical protein
MKSVLLVLPMLAACATGWTQAGGRYTPASQRFAVDLPQGWMRATADEELLATRDGPFLQRIYSKTTLFGVPQKPGKKAVTKGMLPEEAAEIVRDEILSQGAAEGLTVSENSPATLAAKPGFRLVFGYKLPDGLRMKGVLYGALGDDALYAVGYVAPERYYFERDLPLFEKVRASFRILPATARAARTQ